MAKVTSKTFPGTPKVIAIQLECTPEEWAVLCISIDYTRNLPANPAVLSLQDKISAINKRLVFASSVAERD